MNAIFEDAVGLLKYLRINFNKKSGSYFPIVWIIPGLILTFVNVWQLSSKINHIDVICEFVDNTATIIQVCKEDFVLFSFIACLLVLDY